MHKQQFTLPPLNFDLSSHLIPRKRRYSRDGEHGGNDNLNASSQQTPSNPVKQFDFINSVNDDADKNRGPRMLDDVHANVDNVSADDLLVEKTMMVKWLIARYKPITSLSKPRDVMFAIIECICTGLKVYFTTQQGDCCYIDRIQIFNGQLFCSLNEWMLGIIGEENVPIHNLHSNVKQKINTDIDTSDFFMLDDDISTELLTRHRQFTSNTQLPPLLCIFDDTVWNTRKTTDNTTADEKIIEETKEKQRKKRKIDIEHLKQKYSNINVDVIADRSSNCYVSDKGRILADVATSKENVVKLIIDMQELERLIVFLLYVDREAENDINVHIKNKPGTNASFCTYKKSGLSNELGEMCLENANRNRIHALYDTIKSKQEKQTACNNRTQASCSGRVMEQKQRMENVFEWLTFLFIDKVSASIIQSLLLDTGKATNMRSYKFGIIDLLRPRIGKKICTKGDVKKDETPNYDSNKVRTNIIFDS